MLVEVNYKRVQTIMNEHWPECQVTEAQAAEAFHNLVGLLNLLSQINDRVGLVPDIKKR
ncbi:MAG: hypothetical protein AB7H77_00540 [Bdellovibrionales bacterium]